MSEEKNSVGRPSAMTPAVIQKLEDAFSYGASDREACFYAGIACQTLYNYIKVEPSFLDRKEDLKEKLVLLSRKVIAENLQKGAISTAQWYLERKKKSEFAAKTESELTGKDGKDLFPQPLLSNIRKDQTTAE